MQAIVRDKKNHLGLQLLLGLIHQRIINLLTQGSIISQPMIVINHCTKFELRQFGRACRDF
jgi:hypothetical protein